MIKLINGRGQIGAALQKILKKEELKPSLDIAIYHTWSIEDKSEPIQKECYEKFKEFVNKNLDTKIIFTSTYSQTENYYTCYKQLSEAYLINNHERGYVVRLPTLIGKGICEKFRNNSVKAFGNMELMTIDDAARKIIEFALSNSKIRNFRVYGEIVLAELVKNLILYGKEKN